MFTQQNWVKSTGFWDTPTPTEAHLPEYFICKDIWMGKTMRESIKNEVVQINIIMNLDYRKKLRPLWFIL